MNGAIAESNATGFMVDTYEIVDEIKDVDLTLVNDPLPVLVITGTGRTDLFGPLQFSVTDAR